MLFDTDILIWARRGNLKAAESIEKEEKRSISVLTYMELLQCAQNKRQHDIIRDFLKEFDFQILPLSEDIGHRAAVYIEEYSLSNGIEAGDAIIAATAVENGLSLHSGNAKHFRQIKDLKLKVFRP